jgi:hypothetical protein
MLLETVHRELHGTIALPSWIRLGWIWSKCNLTLAVSIQKSLSLDRIQTICYQSTLLWRCFPIFHFLVLLGKIIKQLLTKMCDHWGWLPATRGRRQTNFGFFCPVFHFQLLLAWGPVGIPGFVLADKTHSQWVVWLVTNSLMLAF